MTKTLNTAGSASRRSRVLLCILTLLLMVGIFQDTGLMTCNPLAPTMASAADPFDDMFTIGKDGVLTATSAAKTVDFKSAIEKYRNIALVITSVLTITMLIFMLLQFTKLGAAGDNEMQRKKAIMGILTTGIATGLLGSATIVVGFFWNALTK